MAACTRGLKNLFISKKFCRVLQFQDERFLCTSVLRCANKFVPPSKPVIIDKTQTTASLRKFLSPEFIPPRGRTDPFKYFMERRDMVRRRKSLNIPEFYVGSILAVTMADPNASAKTNRFVGICIQRGGRGLGATFVLRNILNGQGVEICYELYSPRIQSIEVLKLEKRLDSNLMYLRDAMPEYSTVDPEMKPVPFSPTGEVPRQQVKSKNASQAVVQTLGTPAVQHPGHPLRPLHDAETDGVCAEEICQTVGGVRHAEGVRHLQTGGADPRRGPAGHEQVKTIIQDWKRRHET
ncbi:39S ribosomal protein L19, mitochondrial [Oryzias melastigma]|uniref:Large ribosomal subunit protein bL19m n=1 Tax=Oryzias melastigma TaxID=30732 RepID=A0A834L0R1_ORYME|nr:39S ribosomal protein L19, mitochondrial [Oryzias melastigma]